MRYLSSISLALVALMALACTAAPATPAPTPDVPLLDEKMVVTLVRGHLGDGNTGRLEFCYENVVYKQRLEGSV